MEPASVSMYLSYIVIQGMVQIGDVMKTSSLIIIPAAQYALLDIEKGIENTVKFLIENKI